MRALLLLCCLLPIAAQDRLPTGWRVSPAGESFSVSTSPVYAHVIEGGRQALVLHSGYHPPSLSLIDLASRRTVSTLVLPDAGFQFSWDAAEARAYVPTGHDSAVIVASLRDGVLTRESSASLSWPGGEYPRSYATATAIDRRRLFVVETLQDSIAVLDRKRGTLLRRIATPARPTRALVHQGLLYVATLGADELAVFSIEDGARVTTIPVSAGPSDLLFAGGRLYVAAANSNFVDILDVGNPRAPKPLRRINLAPAPNWPVGMTPNTLTHDPVSQRIYVACSDANAVAVLDLSGPEARAAGFLPTGWYPTFALPLPDAGLLVLNGKGNRSYPNPRGPNPTVHRRMTPQPPSEIEYIPLLQLGSAQVIRGLDAAAVKRHTEAVYKVMPTPKLPRAAKLPKQIEHVIFIMKENRTYDQVLGDLEKGNGDPSLCLFPEKITPNHHKLAREFALFDNFYVNADVSAEGWYWTSAAITPHFIMKGWPASYAGRAKPQGDSAGSVEDPTRRPPGGYLWTQALKANLPFRNYGFFVRNKPGAQPGDDLVASISDPAILPYTNPKYAGYDPAFPDVERARIFLEELARFEKEGSLPRLIVMVLPNDHTWGTAPGKLTPFSSMADNDAAFGQIVEGVSKSRFWPKTAIFVLEDDAQNGPDHVDSHRAPAYVISPYTRRGFVDSNFYNTTSMLRTIGMILGTPPLTHYDATAPPILAAWQSRPDLRPYEAEAPRVSLTEKNPEASATAARSLAMDFSEPDLIDDDEMNEILWLAIKGTEPPPPTRSAFLESRGEE
ncbi:MAG: hypothetical protein IPM24_21090 [Bryobacterales bacterium]|nr:hypothetical protein [Bryobacterales bacterium]